MFKQVVTLGMGGKGLRIPAVPIVSLRYTTIRYLHASSMSYQYKTYAELILGKRMPKLKTSGYDWKQDIPPSYTFVSHQQVADIMESHHQQRYNQVTQHTMKLLDNNQLMDIDELIDLLHNENISNLTLPLLDSQQNGYLTDYYRIIQKYETFMINNIQFQELYIKYAYHMNDLATINKLFEKYITHPPEDLNDVIIKYIIGSFTYNYELERASKIFFTITNLKRDLGTDVLEFVVLKFIKSDTIFENLLNILQTWIFSRNSVPNAKIMSMILFESYIYGTLEEIKAIETLVYRYKLNNDYLIRKSRLSFEILSRNKNLIKKSLTNDDILEINKISEDLKALGDLNSLKHFYYSMLKFVSKYCDFKDIEIIINRIKKYNIPITEDFYTRFSSYYIKNGNFLELIEFIKTCSMKINFKLFFLRILFKSFVKSYPHHAPDFEKSLKNWIINTNQITNFEKQFIMESIKIKEMESELIPYVYGDNKMNQRKYKLSEWQDIASYKNDKSTKSQHIFRIDKGFPDLIERGIKPDFLKIFETFKQSNMENREKLIELTHKIRLESKFQDKLSLENLKFATKDEILEFYHTYLNEFNTINKIQFSKIIIRHELFQESLYILNNLNHNELTDSLKISILIHKLQIFKLQKDFASINKVLQEFPLNDIKINPYLINQVLLIKQYLIKYNLPPETSEVFSSFINNATMQMAKDDNHLNQKVSELFDILNNWITK